MGVLWSKMERVLSKEIQRNQLKPGDHIYTRRPDDSKSDGIFVCKDYVIHQADKGYRMLRTRIDNFLDGILGPHLDENNGEDSAVYFKTGRVSRSEQALSLLAAVCFTAFGQSSSSPFGSQSVFGQSSNASSNPFATKPFGGTTPVGSQTGSSLFGGTSTGVFGTAQTSFPFSSTTTFGASSSPAFGSSVPAFGASSSPAFATSSSSFGGSSVFGQKPVFGGFGSTPTQMSPFGSTTQPSSLPAFGSSIFGSSTRFGASSQSAFGATGTPAFGATGTPAFGATGTPAFGASSTPAFGATSTPAFGSTASPTFGSTGTAFGVSNAPMFGSGAAFGASSAPAFGSSTSAFGTSSTPGFGVSSASSFGASTTPSRIDNFLDGIPHLDENNGEDSAVYFKTGRVSRSEQALSLLVTACIAFFLRTVSLYPGFSPMVQLLWVLSGWQMSLALLIESRTPKEDEEFSPLAALKKLIFLTYSVVFYTAFGIPEWITLFCWSIFQRNFNLFKKISVEQLNPGDHIYTWRGYAYTHHGIYAGDKKVIHAVRGGSPKMCSSSSSSPFYSSNVYVESIDIHKFLSGGELYVYEYGVNLGYFIAKFRGGACSLASSDPPEDVLHRANFLLRYKSREAKKRKRGGIPSKSIVGPYDLFRSNCEDLAIYCKTSLAVSDSVVVGRSGQISGLFALVGFLISFSTPFLSTDLIRAVAGYCIYSGFRIISDTKYLRRCYRIPVDSLADFTTLDRSPITAVRVLLLIAVLSFIFALWSFWCAIFGGGTECHIFQELGWIIMGIVSLITIFN